MIKILIEGDPRPAARPRFSGRRCYQPASNVEYRRRVQLAAAEAMKGAKPLQGELVARVKLYRRYRPATKIFGDCDNHAKAALDALNGICYVDDRQIVTLVVEKFKDTDNPRAEIEISTIAEKTP